MIAMRTAPVDKLPPNTVPTRVVGVNKRYTANAIFSPIQFLVQSIMTFLLPCLPAIFAPMIAKIMDGSIASADRIDDIAIEPSIIPLSIVDTTAAEPIVCANLSDVAAMMNL